MNGSSSTKASSWLSEATTKLEDAGIATARLDCLVLLEDATGKDRGWLLAHPEFELPLALMTILDARVYRRTQHVPLAYIRGRAEFYGREFIVNEYTLVPRPETETMIEVLGLVSRLESSITSWDDNGRRHSSHRRDRQGKSDASSTIVHTDEGYKVVWEKPAKGRTKSALPQTPSDHLTSNDQHLFIIDVGTGSGAIAITAKCEHPDATVAATDIDDRCLETARQNAKRLDATITTVKGNLLEPFDFGGLNRTIVLLCNLPYVPDNFQINTAATHEPRHALFGGPDGLDLYREMFTQITSMTLKPDYILTESLPPQHNTLAGIAESASYRLQQVNDFIQLFEPAS